jgi:hypothetical protein
MTPVKFPTLGGKPAREVNPAWCKEMGFVPNRFFASPDRQTITLGVVRSSKHGTFAINKASVDYLVSRNVQGLVALLEADLAPVKVMAVEDVAERLADVPTKDGAFGPYWWIDADGEPTGGFSGYAPAF